MAGIELNTTNIFMFFSSIIPFLLVFFMVMVSVFSYNIKGFVYLFGVFLLYMISIPLQNTLNIRLVKNPNPEKGNKNNNKNNKNGPRNNGMNNLNNNDPAKMDLPRALLAAKMGFEENPQSPLCNLFGYDAKTLTDARLSVPSFNTGLISYTMFYLLMPMLMNNSVNFLLIFFLFILLIMDSIARIKGNCTHMNGIILGFIIGAVVGVFYYSIIKGSGNEVLLFNDDYVSNKVACARPTKQTFKCAVYKNGEIIRNLN